MLRGVRGLVEPKIYRSRDNRRAVGKKGRAHNGSFGRAGNAGQVDDRRFSGT